MTALPLSTNISQASSAGTDFKTDEMQYGNGYTQRAKSGINNVVDKWSVAWENIVLSDVTTIVSALNAAGGVDYFTWTPPGESTAKKFVVTDYARRASSGNVYSVTANLKQVFDL